MKHNKLFLALSLVLLSTAALATGNPHSNGRYSGQVNGNASSASAGGSMAQSAVNGTGYSLNGSFQATGGVASAFGTVNSTGVTTGTNVGSYATSGAAGIGSGAASSGAASSGGGTDVEANAAGRFKGGFSGWKR